MPDQSVVEELLEKGARWLARFDETDYETGGSARQRWYLDRAGQMLDAVFPGWREGITREWATELPGYGSWEHRSDEAAAREQATNGHMRLLARWVGPWVPIEEGTDG